MASHKGVKLAYARKKKSRSFVYLELNADGDKDYIHFEDWYSSDTYTNAQVTAKVSRVIYSRKISQQSCRGFELLFIEADRGNGKKDTMKVWLPNSMPGGIEFVTNDGFRKLVLCEDIPDADLVKYTFYLWEDLSIDTGGWDRTFFKDPFDQENYYLYNMITQGDYLERKARRQDQPSQSS